MAMPQTEPTARPDTDTDIDTNRDIDTDPDTVDVVVLGGGAAGLSGALTLARAGRSVVVVDAGAPRNAPASGVHNYLGREGAAPGELHAIGRAEAEAYGAQFRSATATSTARRATADGAPAFTVTLDDGTTLSARRLLVATGVTDTLPTVPGLAERWGRDVLHCPYCHGFEVADEAIGILATSALAAHQALLWRQWSSQVTVFTAAAAGSVVFPDQEREQLDARGIVVVDVPVVGLEIVDDRLTGVRLADGSTRAVTALVTATTVTPNDGALTGLGLRRTEVRMGDVSFGEVLDADANGVTPVAGVSAAGNVTDVRAQVISSAAAGVNAAAMLNMALVQEDTQRAVAAHRSTGSSSGLPAQAGPQEVWDDLYRTRERFWSGRPNAMLEQIVAPLPAGRALDLGCGEGGDAVWLATRGWEVLAVDVSAVALARVSETVRRAGLADRIDLRRTDIAVDFPEGSFELVSAQFLHSPIAFPREQVLRRAADAVAPGGLLLVVGHADVPPWGDDSAREQDGHEHGRHGHGEREHGKHEHGPHDVPLPGPEEVLTSLQLDDGAWEVVRCDLPERTAAGPDGEQAQLHDSVLAVRRRAA